MTQTNIDSNIAGPWFDIIETKLVPPQSTSELLSRDRLEQIFHDALPTARLILVTAPAGAGKSSLSSLWGRQLNKQKIPNAWVNLELNDCDPTRFLSYIAAAIYGALPETGRRAASLLNTNPQGSPEHILRALISDISLVKSRFVLFLEDYYLVQGEEVDNLLNELIRLASGNLLIVLTSREKPKLVLGGLRIKGQLLEVGASELAFRFNEVKALVKGQDELSLPDKTIRLLCEKTEGWIGGIQLFFLAVKGGSNSIELLQNFSGSDRDITDYLSETVLHQLPEDIRNFLLKTAHLERMCDKLCQKTSGNTRSKAMLEELERRNLFIIPLDRDRHWYRYHHLFAEFLKNHFETVDPEGVSYCLDKAMRWSKAHGFTSEAITYAIRAKDFESASQMISEIVSDLVQYRGAHTTLLSWVKRLPEEYLTLWPLIRLCYAWSLTFTRRHDEALRQLDLLKTEKNEKFHQDVSEDREYIELSVGMIRAVITGLRGQYRECQNMSSDWLERWPGAPNFNIGSVANALGYSCIGTFEFGAGEKAVHRAVSAFQKCGAEYGVTWAWAIEGMLAYGAGNITKAKRIHEDALAEVSRPKGEDSYASGMHLVLLARVLYEMNNIDQAHIFLRDGFYCISEIGSPEFTCAGYTILARIQFLNNSLNNALLFLDKGISLANRYDLNHVVPVLTAEKVLLLLRSGQTDLAVREAEKNGLLDGKNIPRSSNGVRAFEAYKLTNARIFIALGEAGKSNAIVTTLIRSARNKKRNGLLITLLVLKAIALGKLGKKLEAYRSLSEALMLGASLGQIRRFTDEGPEFVVLLENFFCNRFSTSRPQTEAIPRDYLQMLASSCHISHEIIISGKPEDRVMTKSFPIVPLTKREITLLKLVGEGYSNQELADTLYISTKTVKWHLHNAFSKLGVKNRSGAVAQAHKLSLI